MSSLTKNLPTKLWHKRYGHLNFNSMCMLKNHSMVLGIPSLQRIGKVCEACCIGKQSTTRFSRSTTRSRGILDLIHADVCESGHTPSIGGHTYYVSFTDDFSRYTWVFLDRKSTRLNSSHSGESRMPSSA